MNVFTALELLRFDRIAFAHNLYTNNYRYDLNNQGYGSYGPTPENGGVLEIGFVERNPLVLHTADGDFEIGENCIFIIPPGCSFSAETQNAGAHCHISVEFLICCHARPAAAFAPPEGQTITLPLVIEPVAGSQEALSAIRSIAHDWASRQHRNYFDECASFMQLLSKLSQLAGQLTAHHDSSPGNHRYCDRAKAYISEHMHCKLSVGQIAGALGISKNYLTNIFKETEYISLKEYINRRKLSHMLELMRRHGYSIARAGECVGFEDASYISRIFKRYYGVNITQYLALRECEPQQNFLHSQEKTLK